MRIWFDSAGLKTLRIYIYERERERERESTHFFGGREVAVTGGLALELSSSHLSKLKHRTKRKRERESLCRNWLCLWFWALDFLFYLRLLDIYYCTCLAAVFRFLAPVPLAIDSWYTPKIYNVYLGFSNLGHNHILLSPPSNLISLFSCTIN